MRFALFTVLVCLVAKISARGLAGGYERVWFWLAYQIDVNTFGDGREIAKGCTGSGPYNSCNFNEFIKHINGPQGMVNQPNLAFNAVDPDNPMAHIDDMARKLNDGGFTSDANDVNPRNVYPGTSGFNAMFTSIAKAMKATKDTLGDDLSTVQDDLDRIDHAVTKTVAIREAEFNDFMGRGLAGKVSQNGMRLVLKPVTVEGKVYQFIDTRSTALNQDQTKLLGQLMNAYRIKSDGGGGSVAVTHNKLMLVIKKAKKVMKC